ncbi:hypothetical protein HALLA_21320 (plasmid) [Halostagnicola larsenii XH-48]|uniref:Uncharacterized protein n=1 Tax=Halostagnicola larsenii XH-48 TaxID=797299 RepID=W0JV90_9EURY|nr:hypothetical protein HALLA_21320 [Halostagnicola larsenii XH-48]
MFSVRWTKRGVAITEAADAIKTTGEAKGASTRQRT